MVNRMHRRNFPLHYSNDHGRGQLKKDDTANRPECGYQVLLQKVHASGCKRRRESHEDRPCQGHPQIV
jgi:hypothetical protein